MVNKLNEKFNMFCAKLNLLPTNNSGLYKVVPKNKLSPIKPIITEYRDIEKQNIIKINPYHLLKEIIIFIDGQ